MEHSVKTEVSDAYVDEQLRSIEEQLIDLTDVLTPLTNEPLASPEALTDEEVDLRFNKAVKLIEEDTTPEEREKFRELRMMKTSGKTQLKINKDNWE